MVLWEDGSKTFEPLQGTAAYNPVTCTLYAKEHDFLDTPGWKHFKGIARQEKSLRG